MHVSSAHKTLIALLLASFLLPLGYAFYHRIEPVVDARSYDQIALNLVDGAGFKEDRTRSYAHDPSIIRAGPLYEFFLAGIYAIFGHRYEAVWFMQALLHALTAYLVFLIARKIFAAEHTLPGVLAAALIGLHPDLIENSAMLMTETLYLFLVTLTVYAFVSVYHQSESVWRTVFLAVSSGVAILIRPPVALFIPIFLLFFVLRRQYRLLALFVMLLGAVLAPWTVRNYRVYQQFIPTTLIGEYNLWVGNTVHADGGQFSGAVNPATAYLEKEGAATFKAEANATFRQFLREHPFIFLKLSVVRAIRYVSLIRPMGFWFYQEGLPQLVFVTLSGLSSALLFLSGAAGLCWLLKEKKELWYYLAALALSAPLPLLFTVVQSRYRFQLYPFLALFGSYFLVRLWQRADKTAKTVLAVAVVLGVISLVDAATFWPVVAERLSRFFEPAQ